MGKSTVVEISKHALLSLKTDMMINIISKLEILHLNLSEHSEIHLSIPTEILSLAISEQFKPQTAII